MSGDLDLFGKRVRQRMEEKGWSVTEFARQLKRPHSGVSAYLGGKRKAGLKVINHWAKVLEVDPLWLMGRTQSDTVRVREPTTLEFLAGIINRWDLDDQRKAILKHVLQAKDTEIDSLAKLLKVTSALATKNKNQSGAG